LAPPPASVKKCLGLRYLSAPIFLKKSKPIPEQMRHGVSGPADKEPVHL
jgi:hypothetical protein